MQPRRGPRVTAWPACCTTSARSGSRCEILTKPGKLTDREREVMNQHPADGARFDPAGRRGRSRSGRDRRLRAPHHARTAAATRALHYQPRCPLASRLVHVCDVYDALRTNRPYRDAWSAEKAEAYLVERAGVEFDPDLVRAFVTMLREGQVETAVLSDDGQSEGTVP